MTRPDSSAIASWRYPDPYSFYDLDADPDDLTEFLEPQNWPDAYFSVFDADSTLAGFFIYEVDDRVAAIGLGLHPDRTGKESGTAFVAAGLEYGRQRFGLEQYIVEVAQFNLRAINVYRRLRFRPIEEFRQRTNGGVHDFVRMVAPAIRLGACVLMVDNRERIALQLRDAKPNVNDADCWGVFGGGMRPGEAPGETIVREVQEELGVTLPPTGLRWVKQVVSPLLIRSHVHTYRLHDELENARLREGQKFALVGRDEIQVGGVLQGKRVAPFHLELLEDYWAGKLTDA